jgi:DeoR family transcriptional regulator, aga operon transcriptional repressor
MSISTIKRREHILALLNQHEKVLVRNLTRRFKVSGVTIRKDLDVLEGQGRLIKTYGGAIKPQANNKFFTLVEKSRRNRLEKEQIGQLAASLIEDQQCIYMDSGTTVAQTVPHLTRKRGLTVLVHSVKLAVALSEQRRHRIILIGGEFREDHLDTVGDLPPSILAHFGNITMLIGADGVHPKSGVMSVDVESSRVAQSLLSSTARVIVCADHTKFRQAGHYRVMPLDRVDVLVTDREPPDEFLKSLDTRRHPLGTLRILSPKRNTDA